MTKIAKNTICLWYERDAEEAALVYARTFPIRPSARCIAPRTTFRRASKGTY